MAYSINIYFPIENNFKIHSGNDKSKAASLFPAFHWLKCCINFHICKRFKPLRHISVGTGAKHNLDLLFLQYD